MPSLGLPLDELYRGVILEHYRHPHNRRRVENANVEAEGKNPLCGDEVRFELSLADGRVADAGFVGEGCAISVSAASMLTELVRGRSIEEALRLIEDAGRYLKGEREGIDEEELGDLPALEGVAKFPVRVKCALLPLIVVRDALGEKIAGTRPTPTP